MGLSDVTGFVDYEAALRCYNKAIDREVPEAMCKASRLYLKGLGTKPDKSTALLLLKTAATKGSLEARLRLQNFPHDFSAAEQDMDPAKDMSLAGMNCTAASAVRRDSGTVESLAKSPGGWGNVRPPPLPLDMALGIASAMESYSSSAIAKQQRLQGQASKPQCNAGAAASDSLGFREDERKSAKEVARSAKECHKYKTCDSEHTSNKTQTSIDNQERGRSCASSQPCVPYEVEVHTDVTKPNCATAATCQTGSATASRSQDGGPSSSRCSHAVDRLTMNPLGSGHGTSTSLSELIADNTTSGGLTSSQNFVSWPNSSSKSSACHTLSNSHSVSSLPACSSPLPDPVCGQSSSLSNKVPVLTESEIEVPSDGSDEGSGEQSYTSSTFNVRKSCRVPPPQGPVEVSSRRKNLRTRRKDPVLSPTSQQSRDDNTTSTAHDPLQFSGRQHSESWSMHTPAKQNFDEQHTYDADVKNEGD
eukprot:GHVQ01028220.1.p1 GENE.GHVQ01028220.1~~GHVQ01028220.1.p1  ORF type:complete len:476 (+),score=75.07 GHVQ01028220.1:168-1595(+)